jgi:hypothetical protein
MTDLWLLILEGVGMSISEIVEPDTGCRAGGAVEKRRLRASHTQ